MNGFIETENNGYDIKSERLARLVLKILPCTGFVLLNVGHLGFWSI